MSVVLVVLGLTLNAEAAERPETARFHFAVGPAVHAPRTFAASSWAVEFTLDKPLFFGPTAPLRMRLDALVSLGFSPTADSTLIALGPVLGAELLLGERTRLSCGFGLGFGALVAQTALLGGEALVQAGLLVRVLDDLNLTLTVRDVTTLVAAPEGIRLVISLTAQLGIEWAP